MEIASRGNEHYTVADGHSWFWKMFSDETWEPGTFRVFDRFLTPESVMLDIGAWIGPTALYAASRAEQVFAFEPDPVAYNGLTENLALNHVKNVVPYMVAVSNAWKGISFGIRNAPGDSMSSELWAKGDEPSQVPAVSFLSLIMDVKPSFIKIDIEGGEKFIFNGTQHALELMRPTIHLSLHTPWHAGTPEELASFKAAIVEGLAMYPYLYGDDLKPISFEEAFNVNAFNSIVASFEKI